MFAVTAKTRIDWIIVILNKAEKILSAKITLAYLAASVTKEKNV
jgi:hypothetical protein